MMLEIKTLARPYAHAFFEHALHEKALPEWSFALRLLSEIAALAPVNRLLHHPNVAPEERAAVIIDLAQGCLSQALKNSLRLLAIHGRLHLLPVIFDLFETLRLEQEKTVTVQVTSAVALEDNVINTLKTLLEKKLNKHTEVHSKIDPSILGGLLIRTGDIVIDGSVKGQLHRLKEALMESSLCN